MRPVFLNGWHQGTETSRPSRCSHPQGFLSVPATFTQCLPHCDPERLPPVGWGAPGQLSLFWGTLASAWPCREDLGDPIQGWKLSAVIQTHWQD